MSSHQCTLVTRLSYCSINPECDFHIIRFFSFHQCQWILDNDSCSHTKAFLPGIFSSFFWQRHLLTETKFDIFFFRSFQKNSEDNGSQPRVNQDNKHLSLSAHISFPITITIKNISFPDNKCTQFGNTLLTFIIRQLSIPNK